MSAVLFECEHCGRVYEDPPPRCTSDDCPGLSLREQALHDEALYGKPASCHTAGPWVIADDGTIESRDRGLVGYVRHVAPQDRDLIAAAPDLYDLLLDTRNLLEDPCAEAADADDLLDRLNTLLKRLDS